MPKKYLGIDERWIRHDWRLWRTETPHMLSYADHWLSRSANR